MATTIRTGAKVHASGLGGSCQYKGVVSSMATAKEWMGFDSYTIHVEGKPQPPKTFRRTLVHHVDDCPRGSDG